MSILEAYILHIYHVYVFSIKCLVKIDNYTLILAKIPLQISIVFH